MEKDKTPQIIYPDAYVFSELPRPQKTLSALEDYVNTEIEKIRQQKDWKVRFKAYQSLKIFTHKVCENDIEFLDSTEEMEAHQELSFRQRLWIEPWNTVTSLLALSFMMVIPIEIKREIKIDQRIQDLLDSLEEEERKTKTYGLMPILNTFDVLTDKFKQTVNRSLQRRKNIDLEEKIQTFFSDLEKVKMTLNDTVDLEQFRTNVHQLCETLSDEAKFEINGKNRWFQTYIVRPFERFKASLHRLFESIFKTYGSISIFSQEASNHENTFDTYQKKVEQLADYKPPEPTSGS